MSTNYIDKLISIYLSGIQSISNDAGWDGDSMMARLIDFHGDLPMGTGNDQSNLSMILAIEKLRDKHHDFSKINLVVTEMLRDGKTTNKMIALLSRHYYTGINPLTSKPYTDIDRMLLIGGYYAQGGDKAAHRFGDRVRSCYEILEAELDKYERYQAA